MQALYLTRNARGLPASARRYSEEVIPDLETDVEEEIIHTITLQKLREVLTALPKEDVALLTALYLQTPPLTLRAYSEQTGIPVMTLHY